LILITSKCLSNLQLRFTYITHIGLSVSQLEQKLTLKTYSLVLRVTLLQNLLIGLVLVRVGCDGFKRKGCFQFSVAKLLYKTFHFFKGLVLFNVHRVWILSELLIPWQLQDGAIMIGICAAVWISFSLELHLLLRTFKVIIQLYIHNITFVYLPELLLSFLSGFHISFILSDCWAVFRFNQ